MKYWQLAALLSAIYGSQTNWLWANVAFCLFFLVFAIWAAAKGV